MGPFLFSGAPGEIRTPDHLVRSQVLYPTELRALYSYIREIARAISIYHRFATSHSSATQDLAVALKVSPRRTKSL